MPGLRDPLPGRAMVPRLLTTLPTPRRWWYLPMLRGDDHCRRAHRKHRREPTLARGQHTRPSLKKPPRFEGKLSGADGGRIRGPSQLGSMREDTCAQALVSVEWWIGRRAGSMLL